MSYAQNDPYGQYPQRSDANNYQQPSYGASPSRANLYPPYNDNQYSKSQDSLDAPLSQNGAPISGGGASGSYGATGEKLARDRDNPYAQNYKGDKSGGGRGKWIILGIIVLCLAGAGAGIAVWRVQASKKTASSSSSTSNTGGTTGVTTTNSGTSLQYIKGTAGVVKSNPQDPSDFEKDSTLHNVFHGIAYTPFLAQAPWCGCTLANVTEDIQIMSQLTTRLRTYGTACNQTQLILQAIQDTKVNMTIYIGAYIGDNTTVNAEQQTDAINALKIYGSDHVSGVIIGNEYLLNTALSETTASPTAISLLSTQMAGFRTALKALSLPKTIPVGTADAGSMISLAIAEASDFFMANVHPFFGGLAINDAAAWTDNYYRTTDLAVCTQASNSPACHIAETGWPTKSMTVAAATDGAAVAGVPELQVFLDDFICQANANGTSYFYFSPWDEPWKVQFSGVEPYWGLADSNKIWKNITLPSC
ncbi:hypothetical protein RQP46_008875 [Phenoliferia psychrophenolica]